jgi:hypothetical protein
MHRAKRPAWQSLDIALNSHVTRRRFGGLEVGNCGRHQGEAPLFQPLPRSSPVAKPRLPVTYSRATFLWFSKSRAGSQGTHFFLGTFPDAVSAAIRYDAEAKRAHGRYALLNFRDGTQPLPTFTSTPIPYTLVPGGGGSGQEPQENEGLLPAGIPEGTQCLPLKA